MARISRSATVAIALALLGPGGPAGAHEGDPAEAARPPQGGIVPPPPPPASVEAAAPGAAVVLEPRRTQEKNRKKSRKRRGKKPRGDEACEFRTPVHEHAVVKGEALGLIAGRYGVRRADLVNLNPQFVDPDVIHPGDVVRVCPVIPPRNRVRIDYVVQPGDTLDAVAAQYETSVRDLVLLQRGRVEDPNRILVGQKLEIWTEGTVLPQFAFMTGEEIDEGTFEGGRQLRPGAHYHIKRPQLAYGTPKTIRLIRNAIDQYGNRRPGGPKVYVGDISKRGGGKLSPHVSHRAGRDVDVGYVRRGADANNPRFTTVTPRTLDVPRTWELVKSFLATHEVRYIFMDYEVQRQLYEYARSQGMDGDSLDELFQYPRGIRRPHGLIRHWRSHRNHFHVRFR